MLLYFCMFNRQKESFLNTLSVHECDREIVWHHVHIQVIMTCISFQNRIQRKDQSKYETFACAYSILYLLPKY